MRKLINIKDSYKMLIIYFITTIANMVASGLIVEYDYIKIYLRNYLWVLIIFTILFLLLIRLFKVKFRSVLVFLGIIMFLLLFALLNLDLWISRWSTPDDVRFPIMAFIALYTTLPFQNVINFLVGYDVGKFSYIVVPIYMFALSLLSYITLKFKINNYSK